jgi:hypothetical protein
MAHGHQPHQPLPAAPDPGHHASAEDEYLFQPHTAGHEHSDANVWIIIKFGLWLAISAIVVSGAMGLLFGLFVQQSEETNPEFPLAVGQERRLPAAPRLQQFPVTEMYQFRLHENAVLDEQGDGRCPAADCRCDETGGRARTARPRTAACGSPGSVGCPGTRFAGARPDACRLERRADHGTKKAVGS